MNKNIFPIRIDFDDENEEITEEGIMYCTADIHCGYAFNGEVLDTDVPLNRAERRGNKTNNKVWRNGKNHFGRGIRRRT